MKHFVLLLALGMLGYAAWALVPRGERDRLRSQVRKHTKPIAAIFLALLAGLIYAFYTRSINLL
jgi:membrane-anchored protein YejM (alkaline phosphatase superfamily)